MRTDRLIVLKFGGSVLRDDASLRAAVHEIHRWRRDGWQVVAVVSALNGRTNELAARAKAVNDRAEAGAVAQLLSLGEMESAALLALHLDRAGVSHALVSPRAARFIAEGRPLAGAPVSIDAPVIDAALKRDGVVVFPGFIAVDGAGRAVTLGRGGSDLTALFLAQALSAARCRLIKDVDGLYEADPATHSRARLYANASHRDALALDGSILQREAVRFARARGMSFEIAQANRTDGTLVGAGLSTFAPDSGAGRRPLRVALLGLGVVGGGVYELFRERRDEFDIVAVGVRDVDRRRDVSIPRRLLTTDAIGAAGAGVDLVIEAMGGVETPFLAARAALESGADFITANKALMATHGRDLARLAVTGGGRVRCAGAVGGVAPILETIRAHRGRTIQSVTGVLNGTCNFVLDRIRAGESLDRAVREAQRLGFAEADPTLDLSGADVIDKLHVIAHAAGVARVRVTRCDDLRDAPALLRDNLGSRAPLRQVARLDVQTDGAAVASVAIGPVEEDHPLAHARAEWNAAIIRFEGDDEIVVRGKGAGRWPTAEAVVGDALELRREIRSRRVPSMPAPSPVRSEADCPALT